MTFNVLLHVLYFLSLSSSYTAQLYYYGGVISLKMFTKYTFQSSVVQAGFYSHWPPVLISWNSLFKILSIFKKILLDKFYISKMKSLLFPVFIVVSSTSFPWELLKWFMHCSLLVMIIHKVYFNLLHNSIFNLYSNHG